MSRRGADYDRGFREREQAGEGIHGEADLVASYRPDGVLDAGCGTGRVAIELARRGIAVVGVDVDAEMLGAARDKAPLIEWVEADLADVELKTSNGALRRFDVVVMAGNVMIFVRSGAEAAVVSNVARHIAPGGLLIAGFQLHQGGFGLADYDAQAAAAGLWRMDRWSSWDRAPWPGSGDYAVSVHRAN